MTILVASEQPALVKKFMDKAPRQVDNFSPVHVAEVLRREDPLQLAPRTRYLFLEENGKLYTTVFRRFRNIAEISSADAHQLNLLSFKERTWGGWVEGKGLGRKAYVDRKADLDSGVVIMDGATVDSLTKLTGNTVVSGRNTWAHRDNRGRSVIEEVPYNQRVRLREQVLSINFVFDKNSA